MEIEEMELDKEWCASMAILIKSWWNNLHTINCQPKAPECERATLFIPQIMWIVVYQNLRGYKASGCK